ncbi:hypothetical protein M0R45_001626 [Rubus argutus]|uniref:Uncharacterized protein n=1 Tax=Rubus argutus TaxID=59490 RepID=A0AAW1VLG4_RUBAR
MKRRRDQPVLSLSQARRLCRRVPLPRAHCRHRHRAQAQPCRDLLCRYNHRSVVVFSRIFPRSPQLRPVAAARPPLPACTTQPRRRLPLLLRVPNRPELHIAVDAD